MSDATAKLRAAEWEVRPVKLGVAQEMVIRLHYARGGSNTGIATHGLFRKGADRCMGVAWWLPPTRAAAEATYPTNWGGVLSLTRLVIEPEAPPNAASFLLGASMRLLDRKRWPCLVTYADTWRGHTGGIYRATNWSYVGLTKPQPVFVLNGQMVARKRGAYSLTRAALLEMGAECLGSHAKHKFVHIQI